MELTKIQVDALQELGNIGAAHAATTLSTMLSAEIEMNVPEINVVDIADIYKYVGDEIAALGTVSDHGGGIIRGLPSPLYTKRICHPSYQCNARHAAN